MPNQPSSNGRTGRDVAVPDENRPDWRPQDEPVTPRIRRNMTEDDDRERMFRERDRDDDRFWQRERDRERERYTHWEDRSVRGYSPSTFDDNLRDRQISPGSFDEHSRDRHERSSNYAMQSGMTERSRGYSPSERYGSGERYGVGDRDRYSDRYDRDRYADRDRNGDRYASTDRDRYERERYSQPTYSTERGYTPERYGPQGGYNPERYGAQGGYGGGRGFEYDRGAGHEAERMGTGGYLGQGGQQMGYSTPPGAMQTGGQPGQAMTRTYGNEAGPHTGHRGKGPAGYVRSDERIKEIVNDVLTEDDRIDATHVEIAVKGGEVTLSGTVEDRRQKRFAEECVENIAGVRDVHNQLRIGQEQGAPEVPEGGRGDKRPRA